MYKKTCLIIAVLLAFTTSLHGNRAVTIRNYLSAASPSVMAELKDVLLIGRLGFDQTENAIPLSSEAIAYLAPRISRLILNMPWLTHINLSRFPDAALYGEFLALNNASFLTPLKCKQLSFAQCGMTSFNINLSQFKKLETLDLSNNRLQEMPKNLPHKTLKKVHLQNNPFPASVFAYKKPSIQAFLRGAPQKIREELEKEVESGYLGCHVNQNQILPHSLTPAASHYVATHFDLLAQHIFWLEALHLETYDISKFPTELFRLPLLKYLSIQHAQIKEIPSEIAILQKLVTLNLDGNPIRQLPTELTELRALTTFSLDHDDVSAPLELAEFLRKNCKNSADLQRKWLRRHQVDDFLSDAPSTLKERAGEIAGGHLGDVYELGVDISCNSWKDAEIDFLNKNLGQLGKISWLEVLNLSGLGLTEVPACLTKMPDLKYVSFFNNKIEELPDDFDMHQGLTILSLEKNRIQDFPVIITELPNLEILDLSENHIRKFIMTSKGAFPKLRSLFLSDNLLNQFDLSGNAPSLNTLYLDKNCLTDFWCDDEEFLSLRELHLFMNQFTEFPLDIALRETVTYLDVSSNFIEKIPPEVWQLRDDLRLYFDNNPPLQLDIDAQTYLNLDEYMPFCCEVPFSGEAPPDDELPRHACMTGAYKSLEDLYRDLPVMWNMKQLPHIKLPDIPPQNLTPVSVFANWVTLWNSMNFDDKTDEETYQDFELYKMFLVSTKKPIPEEGTNAEKMRAGILMPVNGFIKKLFRLPCNNDETAAWIINEAEKPAMQTYVAFLINEMSVNPNISLFIQFISAILYCPTGQKTGFEAMVINAIKPTTAEVENPENLETLIKKLFASEKEHFFHIIANQADPNDKKDDQSVHLIEYYKRQLSDILGLMNMSCAYRDFHEITRPHDLFHGNLAKALEAFYSVFTPAYFINKLYKMTETNQDRALKFKITKTEADHKQIKACILERPIKLASLIDFLDKSDIINYSAYEEDESTSSSERDSSDDDKAKEPEWKQYFSENPTILGKEVTIQKEIYVDILKRLDLLLPGYKL